MDKLINDEELQSRRTFFKNAAKGALPILGISLLGTTILTSCEKQEPTVKTKCDGCSGSCSGKCSGSCDNSCSGNCEGCDGSCDGTACTYM